MRKIIDLSQDIYGGMPGFPGDPEVKIQEHSSVVDSMGVPIGEYRWNALSIVMTDHHGTHVDAPYHLNPKGKKIHEMPAEQFITEAVVLNLSRRTALEIGVGDLDEAVKKSGESIRQGDAVLLHTGWDKRWGTPEYMAQHPWLNEGAARWLLEKRIGMVGIDTLDPDLVPDRSYCHVILLADAGIPIIENLCNLDKIRKARVTFLALPLKIRGATGSPIRAIAIEE